MQSLQWSQGDGQLADVFGSLCDRQDNLLPMRFEVGGTWTDVKMRKVCFGAWVRNKHPAVEEKRGISLGLSQNMIIKRHGSDKG